jgi:hypothetical protein
MWFTRRRSDRPDPARLILDSSLEALEGRTLLSVTKHASPYVPSDLPVYTAISHQPIHFSINGLVQQAQTNPQAAFVNNEGKIVSGRDRAGNTWTITVHGPGTVLVTDTTPNDGELDDSIDTIQLIGTNPHTTYVTGQTTASNLTLTDGVVSFNKLIDTSGVKSVILNGFTLTQTVTPPNGGLPNSDTGIFLYGGVGMLQFHDIIANIDQSTNTQPINIVIGDPETPITTAPQIRLDSIFNTVFSSTATSVPTSPQTTGTVNIIVNGQLGSLDMISSTQQPVADPAQQLRATIPSYGNQTNSPIASAGNQFQFPIVGTTGRTAVRATGIGNLNVHGSAVNVTASRGAVPFQNGLSGLDHLGKASFGGNADALGLDVNGKIGSLNFSRGLGNPTGASTAQSSLGIPAGRTGYPAAGLLGGLVTSTHINKITVKPANVVLQNSTNPNFVSLNSSGDPTYFPRVGNALTSAAIVSAGSIGSTNITGDTVNSEIKAGFHYPSFAAGLEGTRAKSTIAPVRVKGDLVNGDISATYRPFNHLYGTIFDTAGNGKIIGHSNSNMLVTGGVTPLGNQGAGFYARLKAGGYLPPPEHSSRNSKGVLIH